MSSPERIAPVTNIFGDRRAVQPVSVQPVSVQPLEAPPRNPQPSRATRRAENVSLAGLTRRNMSRWEIEQLLTSRNIDEDIIAAEVSRLEGVGLIDDAALAETLVRTGRERKGLGRQALVSELRRRHIDNAIIEEAVHISEEAEDSEQERALELAHKRARTLHSYDRETVKRRLTGFLMRKGYSSSIVHAAVTEALSGQGSEHSAHSGGGVRFQ